MGRSQPETVCALQPAALGPVPVPSAALLARLAPLTPVPGRPDLVAHHAPDVIALWQAWEDECGAPQAVPFWATVWPAGQLLARVVQAAYSTDVCHPVQRKVATQSTGSLPPNPWEGCHPVHVKPATWTTGRLPPMPGEACPHRSSATLGVYC